MNNKENFVSYEYKSINTTRDSAAMYIDSMSNFGWTPVEDDRSGFESLISNLNPLNLGHNIANAAQTFGETADGSAAVTLKFRRDRNTPNKQKLNKLEKEYEDALSAINRIERKNAAQTMGISMGTGIIGAVFVGLSVYSFISSNVVLGILFAAVGAVGWAIGFFSNKKVGDKKSTQTEPKIQEQLNVVYNTCEKAHALLA